MIHKYAKSHFFSSNYLVCTYYLQLEVVSQAGRAVHSKQNGVFLLGAEPEG